MDSHVRSGRARRDRVRRQHIAANHARDLPGVKVNRGEFALAMWRDVATAELAKWATRDQELREAAADRLSKSDELVQLFGVSPEWGDPAWTDSWMRSS